ncbi:MAG TPA: hypothetical protein VMV81_05725 [Phycisphaerae bacterium]|nr:hypothetical protein [Phycisphaerae bacterium]
MLKAIGKKHRQMKEAEEFAAAQYSEKQLAEQRAANLERELAQLKAKAAPPPEPEKAPERNSFQSDEEYANALIDWKVDQRLKAREAERAQKEEEERQQRVAQTAKQRIAKALELVPDFREVTEAADLAVPAHIAGYMQESDLFAELGYHLAKHPEELEKLQKMPPAKSLVELGKIESRLKPFESAKAESKAVADGKEETPPAPSTITAKAPSRPSAPITPISAGSAVQVEKPDSELTYAEAKAKWQRENRVNLNRRERH